jgi:hypothetical protein
MFVCGTTRSARWHSPDVGWIAVGLEFHQLELRYERLRVRQPARERRLLASLADAGQQMPIVVVTAGSTSVVVDGHKPMRRHGLMQAICAREPRVPR